MDQELYHHGIKNMKWGVRRYQNPDGSLTPAGRKRYSKSEKFRAKVDAKQAKTDLKKQLDNNVKRAAKQVKDMSDDDIRSAIARKKLEREFLGMYDDKRRYKNKSPGDLTDEELTAGIERARIEKQYREAYPKQVSFVKKFAKSALNDVIVPAVRENAKTYLSGYLKKRVEGLLKEPPKKKSELERLKDEAERMKALDSIDMYRDQIENRAKKKKRANRMKGKTFKPTTP
jgi:hypothetical protein